MAYVANTGSTTVSVIDTVTNVAVSTIPVGRAPLGIAVAPDQGRVYVGNAFDHSISVIDAATNSVTDTIAIGAQPNGLAVSPDGGRLYVAANRFLTDGPQGVVVVIDTSTDAVVGTIEECIGCIFGYVGFSPDGRHAYVSGSRPVLDVIDTATLAITASIRPTEAFASALGIVVSPDGSRVYLIGQKIAVVSTETDTIIGTLPANGVFLPSIAPDGHQLYLPNINGGVTVEDTHTGAVTATVDNPQLAYATAVTPDGRFLYVTSARQFDGSVAVIDTTNFTVVASVPVGDNPSGIAIVGPPTDTTAPTVNGSPDSAPNAAGWYRAPVTISWTATDPDPSSGTPTTPPPTVAATDGANVLYTSAPSCDPAGNCASGSVSLSIDQTPPSLSISGVTDGGTYTLGAAPTPSCAASDALSGLAGACTGTLTGGNSNAVGTFTYTATASDVAGNATIQTVRYQVVYGFSGFLQPINDTAHQTGIATSVFKAGSTVPVKFQLTDVAGNPATTSTPPVWLTPAQGGPTSAAVNESLYGDTGSSGSTFTLSGGQYAYNWKTSSSQAGRYWRIGVVLDDGTVHWVNIGLR